MTPSRSIRIVTLNTWKCDGEYDLRLPLMANGLAMLQPDFVLLQEDFRQEDGTRETSRYLADHLSMRREITQARKKWRRVGEEEVMSTSGLAVLARWPIQSVEKLSLPTHPDDGDRDALIVVAYIGGICLLLCNTHMTHLQNEDPLRRLQLETIIATLNTYKDIDLIVLGGDFNCPPESEPIQWLTSQQDVPLMEPAMTGLPFTASTLNPISPDTPSMKLDYLFLSLATENKMTSVPVIRRIMDKPAGPHDMFPSDHAGLSLDISLSQTNSATCHQSVTPEV